MKSPPRHQQAAIPNCNVGMTNLDARGLQTKAIMSSHKPTGNPNCVVIVGAEVVDIVGCNKRATELEYSLIVAWGNVTTLKYIRTIEIRMVLK